MKSLRFDFWSKVTVRWESDFVNLGFSLCLRFPLWWFYLVIKQTSDSSPVSVVNI